MSYNSYNPYYSTDINYMHSAQQTSYLYSGYYNPYSYYTYECSPITTNVYSNTSCYAAPQPEPVHVSRHSSKKNSSSSSSSTSSKTVTKIVHKPERILERISEPKIEQEQPKHQPEPVNESKPTPTQSANVNNNTEGFEFIEIKGIRGIWVKKDSTKNPNILINNYLLDTEKEKLIEDCEPSDPIVIRERPPEPPKAISPKVVTIPGKRMSPPPRRVIIEKQPPQPQTTKVIVERWLPYEKQERRVIVQKPACETAPAEKQKNLIIEWEPTQANTEKKIQILGVESADPNEYIAKYGPTLKTKSELPKFALNVKGPDGVDLDETSESKDHRLVGDLEGLNLIDLDKEGLSMYKKYVENKK